MFIILGDKETQKSPRMIKKPQTCVRCILLALVALAMD